MIRFCKWVMRMMLTVTLISGCRPQAKVQNIISNLEGPLTITLPDSVVAGEEVVITVRSTSIPEEGTPITFLTTNGLEHHVYQSKFSAQVAQFTLPSEDTRSAGAMTIIARSGQAYGDVNFNIQPAPATSPIFLVAGPRTLVASYLQKNMAVIVANDAYGNAVGNGSVNLEILYADQSRTRQSLPINHLVAWSWIGGTTAAGTIRLSAQMGDASAPENNLDVVANSPQKFAISATPSSADADGKQLINLRTSLLRDTYNNVVQDGTQVLFVVQSPTGQNRIIPSNVIDGVAQTPLQAPRTAGRYSVWAFINGIKSEILVISFTDSGIAKGFKLQAVTKPADGAIILTAGPIAGSIGQLMPDGTQVRFSLTDPFGNRQWLVGQTISGYAEVEIRLLSLTVGNYVAEAIIGSESQTLAFNVH